MRTTRSTAGHKNFAVANFSGAGCFDDGVHTAVDVVGLDDHLDLHLGKEVDHVFGASVQLGMALLAPEALDFGDSQPGDAALGQRLSHFFELEWFDDRRDLLHVEWVLPLGRWGWQALRYPEDSANRQDQQSCVIGETGW